MSIILSNGISSIIENKHALLMSLRRTWLKYTVTVVMLGCGVLVYICCVLVWQE